jgi:hypothetical protein
LDNPGMLTLINPVERAETVFFFWLSAAINYV